MAQSISETFFGSTFDEKDVEQFKRYARGRIAYFGKRQILTVVGSGFVALFTTPLIGAFAACIAIFGELIDCILLRMQTDALANGGSFKRASVISTTTAAIQAGCTSVCILMAELLPQNGAGVHFALVFLMSAALNAGLVWPYHKASSLSRLSVYALTLGVVAFVQYERSDGVLRVFMTDALTMLMMAYIVFVILQYVVTSHAKHQTSTEQILSTSQALEHSDRLKRESQEQARKLALVAKHANDSIVISSPNGRITWVNEAFTKITGYSRAEAIDQTPAELLNDDDTDPKITDLISSHIKQGRPIRANVLNKRKNGKKIWVETNIVPIKTDDGEIEMFVAIERDITAIKAHEQELAKAKVLAEQGALLHK